MLVICALLWLPAEGHLPSHFLLIKKLCFFIVILSTIAVSLVHNILLFTSTILAFCPVIHYLLVFLPHQSFYLIYFLPPLSNLLLCFSCSQCTNCATLQVATIPCIFCKNTSHRFIITLHLPFNIPNALSTYILVEN